MTKTSAAMNFIIGISQHILSFSLLFRFVRPGANPIKILHLRTNLQTFPKAL